MKYIKLSVLTIILLLAIGIFEGAFFYNHLGQ